VEHVRKQGATQQKKKAAIEAIAKDNDIDLPRPEPAAQKPPPGEYFFCRSAANCLECDTRRVEYSGLLKDIAEAEHTAATRTLAQTAEQGDEAVGYLLNTGWLYAELRRSGSCPDAVAKWLFHTVAFSATPRLATAAHKALRGLLSDDVVPVSAMLSTWPPQREAGGGGAGVGWFPDHSAFLSILKNYGCQIEGAEKNSAMPTTMNASLLFELWAFAIACRPGGFSAEDIAACVQLAGRAFLDPNLSQQDQGKVLLFADSIQMLWGSLTAWGTDTAWSEGLLRACCGGLMDDKVTKRLPWRLQVARSLPPTPRGRRLQRELGLQILRSIPPLPGFAAQWGDEGFGKELTGEGLEGDVNLYEIVARLDKAGSQVGVHHLGNESLIPFLEAVDLCVDHKPMLEANEAVAKSLLKKLDKVQGPLNSRREAIQVTLIHAILTLIHAILTLIHAILTLIHAILTRVHAISNADPRYSNI